MKQYDLSILILKDSREDQFSGNIWLDAWLSSVIGQFFADAISLVYLICLPKNF